MNVVKKLFSGKGRMNREQFIGHQVLALIVLGIASGLFLASSANNVVAIVFGLVVLGVYIRVYAIAIRRCHDMNWSGVLGFLYGMVFMSGMMRPQAFIGSLLLGVPMLVVLAAVPGTPMVNKYGEVPGKEEDMETNLTGSTSEIGSIQALAERFLNSCFIFINNKGNSVTFSEKLVEYHGLGLQEALLTENERQWLCFEITTLRLFRVKANIFAYYPDLPNRLRLLSEFDNLLREKYENQASSMAMVYDRIAKYDALFKAGITDGADFYMRAGEVVFAASQSIDSALRLQILFQEVAAWEISVQGIMRATQNELKELK